MEAEAKLHSGKAAVTAAAERRTAHRYRFAKLLTDAHFDEAMAEALAAHGRKEIIDADLQFVIDIVRGAERMRARQKAEVERNPATVVAPLSSPLGPAHVS
jgi:hypothetical protein